jgi:DNA-directed RNA polymerase
LKALSDYFNDIISLLARLNLPVVWKTPAGLKLSYSNIKFKSIRTKSKLLPNSKHVTISLPTEQFDLNKMKRSFMPNFIHSLDAANVHLLLLKLSDLKKPCPVYTIHDCFASSPNNMGFLEEQVKQAFIEIYFRDEGYLRILHQGIIEPINSTIGIINIEGKDYIDHESRLPIPDLPSAFKIKDTSEFIKGLLNSKYFIG